MCGSKSAELARRPLSTACAFVNVCPAGAARPTTMSLLSKPLHTPILEDLLWYLG